MSILEGLLDYEVKEAPPKATFLADLAEKSWVKPPVGRRPCPFCGTREQLDCALYGSPEDVVPTYRVICERCGAAGCIAQDPKRAWQLWNGRKK